MIRKLINFIYRITGHYHFTEGQELPDKIEDKEVFIADSLSNNWVVILKCPCGCGDIIHLNTLKTEDPNWKIKHSVKGISIHPSIWRTKKCKSHFWLHNGKIRWASQI